MTEPLSYSQTLRAIGQSLEALGIQNFDIRKSGDTYIVDRGLAKQPQPIASKKSFLKNIAEKVWKDPGREQAIGPRVYSISEVKALDLEGRARRGNLSLMPDTHKLSQALRIVGDYLDRKNTASFIVLSLNQSITINYEVRRGMQARETFTIEDLYNLAVHMYRRRV